MDNADRYKKLYLAVCKCLVQSSEQEQQKETNNLWFQIKHGIRSYDSIMDEIASKTLTQKSNLLSCWGCASTTKSQSTAKELLVKDEVSLEQSKLDKQQPSTSAAHDEYDHFQNATEAKPEPAA